MPVKGCCLDGLPFDVLEARFGAYAYDLELIP